MPDLSRIVFANLLVATGAVAQTFTGIGLGLIAGTALTMIDARFVPGPLLVAASVLSVMLARDHASEIDRSGLWRALLGRLPGAALGVWVLRVLPADHVSTLVAILTIFALVPTLRPSSSIGPRMPFLALFAGLSGFMGTTAAMGGPAMALLYSRSEARRMKGTLAAYFVVGGLLSLFLLAAGRIFSWGHLGTGMALVPGIVLGRRAGRALGRARVDEREMRRAAIGLAAAGPLSLGLLEWFGR